MYRLLLIFVLVTLATSEVVKIKGKDVFGYSYGNGAALSIKHIDNNGNTNEFIIGKYGDVGFRTNGTRLPEDYFDITIMDKSGAELELSCMSENGTAVSFLSDSPDVLSFLFNAWHIKVIINGKAFKFDITPAEKDAINNFLE